MHYAVHARRPRLEIGMFIAAAIAASLASSASAQQFPYGQQHQPFRPGTLTPTNFTRVQQNQHVASYYNYWKTRWLATDPEGHGWHVKLDPDGATVSEGQGYGMVIVAAMAGQDPQAKTIFDGLWQFRRAHPSEIDGRLMDWKHPNDDPSDGDDSAFDGDADIAYGLLMAHAQWGSAGAVNYLAEAKNVIAGIRASTIGPQSRLPMLGDWVSPNGSTYSQWTTRSSDFMPGHFRAYGAATGDAAYWTSVVTATQNVVTNIQGNESAASGLLPDFIKLVGASRDPQPAPNLLEGNHDDDYWFNAGRVPWRLGADAVLNNDPTTLAQVQKMSQWARTSTGGDAARIREGYELNGTPISNGTNHFFTAPFAVAAMTGSTAADQQWLNALYSRVYQRHADYDYYADVVTLQSLLVVTGNFWDPMYVLNPPAPGDFNRDGSVNEADLSLWRGAFGPGASTGDADADGDADGADFLAWQQHVAPPLASASGSAAAEPTSAALAVLAVAAGASTRAARLRPGARRARQAARRRSWLEEPSGAEPGA